MVSVGPQGEGESRNPEMHVSEESYAPVVPRKAGNSWVTPEEPPEGRGAAKRNPAEADARWAQDQESVKAVLERVGQRAKEEKKERFTTLLSHIKVPLLKLAYERLRKDAAAGVDGETWASYGEQLEARLLDLQDRVHRGSYRPQPVRRAYVPKPDGRERPIGIPTLEDKVLQQAVRMLLEPIYESSEFVGVSYGFRPGRSPHMALDALFVALHRKVGWVLDADIRSFFDTIDHGWMQKFIEHRIADRRLVRLLMKWLRAGVMEDGELHETQEGTPQGGIISPLLANIYLHYVLDLWVLSWRKKQARGQVYFVRYADDFVMGFQYEQDARVMREALAERLAAFGLQLHPDKTRVLRFGRFASQDSIEDGRSRPETFDFLGFTHICAKLPDGRFRLVRRTSRKKRRAKLGALRSEMRRRMHDPVGQQHEWLVSVLRGHDRYYGVPGNYRALHTFHRHVRNAWHHRLQRRSQRARWPSKRRTLFEERFPLPLPRILQPHPFGRFDRRHAGPSTRGGNPVR
jgi:group II intron reverse transcriptase/maturase